MIRTFLTGVICVTLFLLTACATPPSHTPAYTFAQDAVKIRLEADSQLNSSENSPHTLLICIYQVKDKSMFEQLADNEDGIYQLLDCEPFNDSVTAVKRLIVQPNQEMTLVMDRMEKTKSLGIAAGYFTLEKSRMTRVFDIPVSIVSRKEARVENLNLFINLGAQQIVGAEIQ